MKAFWLDVTIVVSIFLFGLYAGHVMSKDKPPKVVYKDRVVEKIVYKDKVQQKIVNRVVHIYDKKKDKITTIEEVLNDSSSTRETKNSKEETLVIAKGPERGRMYSLGAFNDAKGLGLENFKPFISVQLVGPVSVIGFTDLRFKEYGLGLSVSF